VAFYTTTASGDGTGAHFEHQDWEGTERMRTSYNSGNNPTYAVEGTYTSLPWGDAQTTASGSDYDAYHFAMLDYDSETGTDHAEFRQYSSTPGSWMRPDPYYGSYDPSNPQSFNRYAYAMNSPLGNIDPSGLACIFVDESGNTSVDNSSGAAGASGVCGSEGGLYVDGYVDPGDVSYLPAGSTLPGTSDALTNSLIEISGSGIPTLYGAQASQSFEMPQVTAQILWFQDIESVGPSTNNGGGGGSSNGPTWKQQNQNCLNTINNTPDGEFYNTFSYASPLLGPDAGLLAGEQELASEGAQRGGLGFLKATAKNWGSTGLGSGSGFVADIWEAVGGFALTPLAVAATAGQVTVHAGCAISAAF
jgi:RHS repeat-associated protein